MKNKLYQDANPFLYRIQTTVSLLPSQYHLKYIFCNNKPEAKLEATRQFPERRTAPQNLSRCLHYCD